MATTTATTTNILGPLTTTFTQPASCTVAVGNCDTCDIAWLDQHCISTGFDGNTGCFPPTTSGASSKTYALSTWGVYSPGLICPSGHSAACSYDGSASTGDFNFYFPPGASETAIGCCPSGFFCADTNKCSSSITTSTYETVQCSSGTSVDLSYQTVPFIKTESSTEVTISTLYVSVALIQMLYQSSDVTEASSASASGSSEASSSSSTSSQSATSSASSQGLSTGAKAGIGVGVALAVILAVTAGVALWWAKRRKGASNGPEDQRASSEGFISKPNDMPPKRDHMELQGNDGATEMLAKQQPMELQGYGRPAELGGHDGARAQGPVAELE